MITITIKGIPKETHRELKRRAAANRRSLNSEVILLLESSVGDMSAEANCEPQLENRSKFFEHISRNRRIAGKFLKKK